MAVLTVSLEPWGWTMAPAYGTQIKINRPPEAGLCAWTVGVLLPRILCVFPVKTAVWLDYPLVFLVHKKSNKCAVVFPSKMSWFCVTEESTWDLLFHPLRSLCPSPWTFYLFFPLLPKQIEELYCLIVFIETNLNNHKKKNTDLWMVIPLIVVIMMLSQWQ